MTKLQKASIEARKGMLASGICSKCNSFKTCLSRLPSTAPTPRLSGGRDGEGIPGIPFDWRFFVFLLLLLVSSFFVIIAFGGVHCEITNPSGSNLAVIECTGNSDDGGNTPGEDENCFGSCTNCLRMTPAEMVEFKSRADLEIWQDILRLSDLIDAIIDAVNEIEPLIDAPDGLEYYTGPLAGGSSYVSLTNFLNYISSVSHNNLVKQAYSAAIGKPATSSTPYTRAGQVAAWNGALAYAENVRDDLIPLDDNLEQMYIYANQTSDSLTLLRTLVSNLPEDPCQDGDDGGGSGDGGGGCDNPNYHDWATKEQGDAMIALFEDINGWVMESFTYIVGVSNVVGSAKRILAEGLFSPYTAIPKYLYTGQDIGEETNKNWKTFYLESGLGGREFGYDPTNILQRIELLLYGISGVYEDDVSNPINSDGNTLSNALNGVSSAFSDLSILDSSSSMLDGEVSSLESLRSAFDRFFSAFSGAGNTDLSETDAFIPSATVNVGSSQLTVPAFSYGSQETVSLANQMKALARNFCTILYLFGAAFTLWIYWSWFASWAVKFSRWATELISTLFAS